jgi:hypothetical protein
MHYSINYNSIDEGLLYERPRRVLPTVLEQSPIRILDKQWVIPTVIIAVEGMTASKAV